MVIVTYFCGGFLWSGEIFCPHLKDIDNEIKSVIENSPQSKEVAIESGQQFISTLWCFSLSSMVH
jgi:hypothetical protein